MVRIMPVSGVYDNFVFWTGDCLAFFGLNLDTVSPMDDGVLFNLYVKDEDLEPFSLLDYSIMD